MYLDERRCRRPTQRCVALRNRPALLLLALPLIALVAYLLMGPVREYLVKPVIYTFRLAQVLYESLPQMVWWGVLLLFLAIFTIRLLSEKLGSTSSGSAQIVEGRLSRATAWSRWFDRSRRGDYSRWLVARQLTSLAVDLFALQERLPTDQVRQYLREGRLALPPEVQAYLEMGLDIPSYRHYSDLLSLFRSSHTASPLDQDPEIVVRFLEDRYESGGIL